MPTLLRLLMVLGLIAGAIFGVMAGFAYLVEPEPREMSVPVPPARLTPQ
jgi:hypothetical protein